MPAEQREKLFEPFERLEASNGTGGAGLGLAIVDRIVRGQHGEFRLAPRPGGGLEASIVLQAAPKNPG